MRVAIYNLEGYKNLALEKIRVYHERQGHQVEEYIPILDETYDKIYCSSIFDYTPKGYVGNDDRWIKGGTGFDIQGKLPPEIDEIKPKLSFGFTTRGCIRSCPFCVVPKKEGDIKAVNDIYDIWDGQADLITLLDNNILAHKEHFLKIADQLKKENLKVDFNQGLDIRLLTDDIAKELATLRHVEYRFAFDFPSLDELIKEKVELLKRHGIKRSMFYVLVGYNTTLNQDLYRLSLLRDLGQNAYVMRYKKDKKYIPIARWANQRHLFQAMSFEKFMSYPENQKYKEYLGGDIVGTN